MADRIKNFLFSISLFAAVLLLWQALSSSQIIPSWMLSPPGKTFLTFIKLISDGTLPNLLLISIANIIPAFLLAVTTSLILGISIGINATAKKMFEPFLSAVYLIPSLAWLPILIIIFGFTRQTVWAVIFISSFVRIIYSIVGGVKGVNLNWILVARNLELTKLDTVIRVILPGAFPQILSGIRVGFGSAWRSLVGAEMLVVTAGGLGKYIWMSQWSFKFEQVLAGIVVIALVGISAEELIFRKIEKATLSKWGMLQ